MSNTPVFPGNSTFGPERRRHTRQQIDTLAYLDIGPDNGGIVLNFCDEGMSIQAVSPLVDQTSITFRIQAPNSRTRIEANAQVVWLSESKCHAGVCFVDLNDDSRSQIQLWLGIPAAARPILEETPAERANVADSPNNKQPARAPRNDKWLSLMSEFEARAREEQASPPAGTEERQTLARKGLESATTPRSTGIPPNEVEPAPLPDEALAAAMLTPRNSTFPLRAVPSKIAPPVPPEVEKEVFPARNAPELDAVDRVPVLASSVEFPIVAPPPSSVAVKPPDPPAATVASQTELQNHVAGSLPALPSTAKKNAPQKWAQIAGTAAAIALLSIVCFGIGKWVGSLDTGIQSASPPRASAAAPPLGGSITSVPDGGQATEPAPNTVDGGQAKRSIHKLARNNQQRTFSLPTKPPAVPRADLEVQTSPPNPSATPAAPANLSENASGSKPLTQNAATVTPAPAPAPVIVAGRVLMPGDRFNPCHLTYRVEPVYPAEAERQRIEGTVKIHLNIGADGTVRSMKLLSGLSLLAPAAMDAAKYWQYLPALLNGQPVESEQDIEIDFRLPQ